MVWMLSNTLRPRFRRTGSGVDQNTGDVCLSCAPFLLFRVGVFVCMCKKCVHAFMHTSLRLIQFHAVSPALDNCYNDSKHEAGVRVHKSRNIHPRTSSSSKQKYPQRVTISRLLLSLCFSLYMSIWTKRNYTIHGWYTQICNGQGEARRGGAGVWYGFVFFEVLVAKFPYLL